ncbi:competence/damage-inducible protein A [Afifella pfennigii]|uniref:competence/damage-inducible protein A n=1 Tax=Afifella pfennigii TaxID=209897 RepID=UPI00047E69E5|nr:competence/damage-inducible protein A [Afifella pfennigii]
MSASTNGRSALPQAAMLVIGDEILSGRTKDKNIGYLADYLCDLGIDLEEVRIVGDHKARIVAALKELSRSYDLVFTCGGIGPTHDDITADAVASAFGLKLVHHPQAVEILRERCARRGWELNEARLRMARTPEGARLIANSVSGAPGFIISNVYVMAGVPAIMQAMLDALAPELPTGVKMLSATVEAGRGEGDIADWLTALQETHPQVRIGSYPYHDGKRFTTRIVLRSRMPEALERALSDVESRLQTG